MTGAASTERVTKKCSLNLRSTSTCTDIRGHWRSTMEEVRITSCPVNTCAFTRRRPKSVGTVRVKRCCNRVSVTSVLAVLRTVGNYALVLGFDDGHDSGIYSWEYLYRLCRELEPRWKDYLQRLANAGASRDPAGPVIIARDVSRTDSQ